MVQKSTDLSDPHFTRGGRLLTEADNLRILTVNGRSKIVWDEQRKCSRCGGQGGSQAWAYTGYTCYKCGGNGGFYTVRQPAYTREQLDKLNAAAEAKQVRAAAERERMRLIQEAKDAEKFKEWLPSTDMDMILWLGDQSESPFNFLKDMANRVNALQTLSQAQYDAVARCYVKEKAKEAKAAGSRFLAPVGERLENVPVRLVQVFDYSTEDYPPITRYKHILETEDGQTVTYTGGSKYFPHQVSDELFLVSGKVKDHNEYRGVKQTVIERPSVTRPNAPSL